MNVFVVNCGSSSLKYQLINSDTEEVIAKGLCERIGIDGKITHTPAGKDKYVAEVSMPDHKSAVSYVLEALTDSEHGVIRDLSEIGAIGHRIVHGGEKFAKSVLVENGFYDRQHQIRGRGRQFFKEMVERERRMVVHNEVEL